MDAEPVAAVEAAPAQPEPTNDSQAAPPAEETAPAAEAPAPAAEGAAGADAGTELGDAKTKCWQNIKMRTKMSILHAKSRAEGKDGGSSYPALNRVADALGRSRNLSPDAQRRMPVRGYIDRRAKIRKERLKYLASLKNHDLYKGPLGREVSRKILMQQKELLENLAALKIQCSYRLYRGRVYTAKLRENLIADLRSRLDAETRAHVEFETKYNALMEEKRQIAECEDTEGDGSTVSSAVVRGLQAQVVSLEEALSRQVVEASKAEEGSDKARADARAAAAETMSLRDKMSTLEDEKSSLHREIMLYREGMKQGRPSGQSAERSPGAPAGDSVEDDACGSPEQQQAEVDQAAAAMAYDQGMESDDSYDSVEDAKDEVLLELSEKLDEAEDELARKEELMREMMDIINLLETQQMEAAEKKVDEDKVNDAATLELAATKAKLEENEAKVVGMTSEIAVLSEKIVQLQEELEATKENLSNAQGSTKEQQEAAEAMVEWKSSVVSTLRGVGGKKYPAALRETLKELKSSANQMIADQRSALTALGEQALEGIASLDKKAVDATRLYADECKIRRTIHNKLIELQGNIRVFLRVRPYLPSEDQTDGNPFTFPEQDGQVILCGKRFEYDQVYDQTAGQQDCFNDCKTLVTSVLDGYHVCIFAYGQTGSGKTFTMEGPPDQPGVNSQALAELFSNITQRAEEANFEYRISVTVLEIYNDAVYDLLNSDGKRSELDVRMGPNGVFVPGLIVRDVTDPGEIVKIMQDAKGNRSVCSTAMNQESSRSHLILTVMSEGENKMTGECFSGKLNLIDLAGSERINKSEVEGIALKEAQNINKSLSYLGDVIQARAAKSSHVPYRNCKLTYLLQDSLGGDGKCLMFVQANPRSEAAGESLCSLNFAARVRNVEMGKAKKHVSKKKSDDSSDSPKKAPTPTGKKRPTPTGRAR